MRKKETEIQGAEDVGLEASLQDIMDAVEDELLVIDCDYQIRYANAAMLSRAQEKVELPASGFCYKVIYGRDRPCHDFSWDCPLSLSCGMADDRL